MTTTTQLIKFDADALGTLQQRRGFLATLAMAAGATALAPMLLQSGRFGSSLLAQSAQCNFPALTGWADREALTDVQILNFALVLEYLEATFYLRAESRGALPMGASVADLDPDGMGMPGRVPGLESVRPPLPATFNVMQFVRTVRNHEIEHVLFLQNALGASALPRSLFAFDFGNAYSSASRFLAVAQILEDVGVTAYLGQVGNIDNTGILAAAGSIAGVEAEHAAGFRLINRDKITPNNVAFDMRRTSDEVIALASPFITAPNPVPPASSFPT
ncbi:MAG TPA: ferritin-like domain-containing protein [Gemmatimonadales bacterium]|nr:ferritin-like domain-containing protein [Gemmatimonadales bacterium]